MENKKIELPCYVMKERRVITRGQKDTGKTCPPGMDYCWECGHVDKAEVFREHDYCPNPSCPNPRNWND